MKTRGMDFDKVVYILWDSRKVFECVVLAENAIGWISNSDRSLHKSLWDQQCNIYFSMAFAMLRKVHLVALLQDGAATARFRLLHHESIRKLILVGHNVYLRHFPLRSVTIGLA